MHTARITITYPPTLFKAERIVEFNRYANESLRELRHDTRAIARRISARDGNEKAIITVDVLDNARRQWVSPETFKKGYQTQ